MQSDWTSSQGLLTGKRVRGSCNGQQASQQPVSPNNINIITVASVKSQAAVLTGTLGGIRSEMMLDSGSAVSLVRQSLVTQLKKAVKLQPVPLLKLITASGEPLPVLGNITVPVQVGMQEVQHDFVVADNLVAPIILGIDFLQRHRLTLDFGSTPVTVHSSNHTSSQKQVKPQVEEESAIKAIFEAEQSVKIKRYAIAAVDDTTAADSVDECAIPLFKNTDQFELP